MGLLDFAKKKRDQVVGFLKENPTPASFVQNKVTNYFKPTGEVRTRDIVRELPASYKENFGTPQARLQSFASTPKATFADDYSWKENPIKKFVATVPQEIINTPVRAARNIGQTGLDIQDMVRRKQFDKRKALQIAGRTGEQVLDALSMGKGKAAIATGNQFLKGVKPLGQLMKEGGKQGLRTGMGYGAGYGASQGVQDENATVGSVAQNTAVGTLAGGVLGGALGGGLPALGALPGSVRNSIKNFVSKPKVTDSIPAHYIPSREKFPVGQVPSGYRATGTQDAGNNTREALTEKLIPTQQKTNRALPTLSDWGREVRGAMPAPGMSIQDVSGGNFKSKNIVDAFDGSTGQSGLGKFGNVRYEIGSLGRNQGARKTGQVDRFPAEEIGGTLQFVKKSLRASNDPKNYRFGNVAHIAEMPNGEKRVVYTRKNANGAEEVINWHKIDETKNPNYLKQLESFGSPDGNRTHILDLEGQRSNPLAYGAETSIAPNGGKVNATSLRQFALPSGNRPLALPNAPGHYAGEGFTMKPGGKRNITDLFDGPAEGIYTVPVKDKNGVAKKIPVSSQYAPNPQDAPKTMGAVRRFFTGGEKVLEKSGKGGKEMRRLMEEQRKQEDLMRGGWNVHIDKALAGLSKEEVSNVDAVLRGEATPINANTAKSSSMLREWFNSIGKTAEEKQFQIQTPDGVKVPFKMRENYAPQMYNFTDFEKGAMRDKALQHLVDTKQARNLGEATKLLDDFIQQNGERRFGNLEKARTIDLPGFERDPAIYAKKYAQSIAKRFSEVDNFGMKDSRIAELVNRIAQEGGDYASAQRIFDYTTKGADQNKIVNGITQYNLATQLDLSALTNITQNINTATKAGGWNTIKGAVKGFTKEGKEIADLAGVDDDFIHSRETGVDLNKVVKFVMWPFKKVEGFNRRTAANAGVLRAQEMAQQKEMTDFAVRELRSLGIDPANIKNGRLSKEDMLSAAYEMARKTQFKVDPLDVPSAWKTPAGKLFTQFQSFSFMQTKFIRDAILKEAKQGNFAPLVRFIPLAIAASYATSYVRNLITGRDPEEANKSLDIRAWDKWGKSFGDFATGKIIQGKFLYDTYNNPYSTPIQKMTRTASTILGPSIGKGGSVINALESMQAGFEDNKKSEISIAKGTKEAKDPYLDTKRFVAGEVPFVGEFVKNKAFAYPASKYAPEEKAQFAKENAVSESKVVNIQLQRGTITPEEAQQKMQDIQESYQKDITKISEKSGSVLPTAQAKESGGNLDSRIQFNPVSGKYNYFDKNGDYKSDTKEKAEQAIAVNDWLDTDEDTLEFGGRFYTKDDSTDQGYTSKSMKEKKESDTNKELSFMANKIESKKDQKDVDGYIKESEALYAKLGLMYRAETDEATKLDIENKMRDIATSVNKYKSYRGFTKPKKGKKISVASQNDAQYIVKSMTSRLKPLRAFSSRRTNLASVSRPNIRRPKRLS
jgi:hypothetical protein